MNYHKTDIHRRILRDIALRVELLFNDRDEDISEYDVQAFQSLFLRRYLKNTDFKVHRESFGKYDCAIAIKETNTPIVLYELKTYLKKKEKLNTKTQLKRINNDLCKLIDGINNNPDCRGYFILVCRRNHLKELSNGFKFIQNSLDNKKNWITLTIESKSFKLRPSRKVVDIGHIRVFSWEVIEA